MEINDLKELRRCDIVAGVALVVSAIVSIGILVEIATGVQLLP